MAISEKGQASLWAHFFHVTPSRSDGIKATEASACDIEEEVLNEN